MSPDISIIIPALNEGDSVRSTVRAGRTEGFPIEWILVDGGSEDATVAVAEEEGCRVIVSDRAQRARQMNLGARAATANVYLFLHADTQLPKDGVRQILDSMANPEVAGGGFVRTFDSDSTILRITCRLAAWRSRRWGLFLGDQGIFVRREIFEKLGGFEEDQDIAEDLDFSLRLRNQREVVALPGPVVSSARRFENRGPLLQSFMDLWLTAKFFIAR